jgi:RNA 2',3'-cyclic 3'-phosphodiesterase
MPRLFTGIEIPAETVRMLAELRGGVFGARWIEPENYHVTLRFIGDVDARMADEVAEMLDDARRRPVRIEFDGLNWFGGDKPRAIVARVRADPALMELQASHERRMRRIGLAPETRNYTPHVTLARLRSASALAIADYLGARGGRPAAPFAPSRFVLYSSRDSVGGGPYRVEASYPLA